ncbi:regulatory protein RecX [Alteromonadaceae bacterium M269]|nr:regulatory protein RecX [Alteromonadaceae bacterium M269]
MRCHCSDFCILKGNGYNLNILFFWCFTLRRELEDINSAITRFLSRREHSEYELVNKLAHKGYESNDIRPALDKFKQANILSDVRFAESRIRDRAYKGYGEYWIRQELKQHQLSEDVIEQAFIEEPQDWFEIAKSWMSKKYARQAELLQDDWKKLQKAKGTARNRGFSQEQINYALECLFNDAEEDNLTGFN